MYPLGEDSEWKMNVIFNGMRAVTDRSLRLHDCRCLRERHSDLINTSLFPSPSFSHSQLFNFPFIIPAEYGTLKMYQLIYKGEVHTMNYAYTYTYTPLFTMILPILALLLILAGGIALYTLFVRKPNHYHGAAAKLHDFLNFRHAYTEGLLKILYCMTVAALAVYSVILLFFHFFWAILLFIVGNIAARLGYEFIMMLFSMHRTLRSIDRKMPEPQPFEQPAPAPQPEPQNTPENPLPPDQP